MTKQEILKIMDGWTPADFVQMNNEIATYEYTPEYLIYDMAQFDEKMTGYTPTEIFKLTKWFFSDYDKFFWFSADRNTIYSGSTLGTLPFKKEEMAEYLSQDEMAEYLKIGEMAK